MQFFETAITLILFCRITFSFIGERQETFLKLLSLVGLIFIVAHYFTEGFRWQLYPVYLLTLWYPFINIASSEKLNNSNILKFTGNISALLILMASIFTAWALPVPQYPAPDGPYTVGTHNFHWVDKNRTDPYAPDKNTHREIMVQIYYPSDNKSSSPDELWLRDFENFVNGFEEYSKIPSYVFGHIANVESYAYTDIPLSKEYNSYPIVIFSHGWQGFRAIHADQAERLASHGYIVVIPDHTYGSMATVFPDNRVVLNNPTAMPSSKPEDLYQKGVELLVDTYGGDLVYVIDQLEKLNNGGIDSVLKDSLDMANLGLIGHSTGGGAVTETALEDDRVKAVIGLDSWVVPVTPELREKSLPVPFMSVQSEGWFLKKGKNYGILMEILSNSAEDTYNLHVDGSSHVDFTLATIFSPLGSFIGFSGEISGKRMMEVQGDYTLAFFNTYLKEEQNSLLDGASEDYPEMIWD